MTAHDSAKDKPVRVDRWLWSIRIFKTRNMANEACTMGRVRVNDQVAKPATKVKKGDRVDIRRSGLTTSLEVVQPIEKRVGAPLATATYVDHSEPAPEADDFFDSPALAQRDRGTGRPTKRDRRRLNEFHRR